MDFSQAKVEFDNKYSSEKYIDKSLCSVDGKFIEHIKIKDVNGNPNEEFYKWEFIFSLIQSGKFLVVIILELKFIFRKEISTPHRLKLIL